MMIVSANYKKATAEDVDRLADAWQDPELPLRQYESVVKDELEAFRNGAPIAPYDTLVDLIYQVPGRTILDVGASSGYYSEVLKICGRKLEYTGVDYSPYYKDFALKMFPGIQFEVGRAEDLPFINKSFDIVLHSACLMHCVEYEKAIVESWRVARTAVIFHRTPVYTDGTPTECFTKEAYGVPCIEFHFNEQELMRMFDRNGLRVVTSQDVFMDGNFGHRSYLLAC